MILKYIGTSDGIDIPDLGIYGWKQGEEKEVSDEVAKRLLTGQAIFEEVKKEKVRGDK